MEVSRVTIVIIKKMLSWESPTALYVYKERETAAEMTTIITGMMVVPLPDGSLHRERKNQKGWAQEENEQQRESATQMKFFWSYWNETVHIEK